MKRLLLSAMLAACLSMVTAGCITVHPDKKAEAPSDFVEVTASPSATRSVDIHPSERPTGSTSGRPSHRGNPSNNERKPQESSSTKEKPSQTQPDTRQPRQTPEKGAEPDTPVSVPVGVPDPCQTLADKNLSKISSKQYGAAITSESPTTIMGRKAWSCRTGSNPSLQLTVLVDDKALTAWRTALQSARAAGDFAYVSGVGTKAFRGGEFVIGVRVDTLVLLYADPEKALPRADAIELVKKTLAKLP